MKSFTRWLSSAIFLLALAPRVAVAQQCETATTTGTVAPGDDSTPLPGDQASVQSFLGGGLFFVNTGWGTVTVPTPNVGHWIFNVGATGYFARGGFEGATCDAGLDGCVQLHGQLRCAALRDHGRLRR